MAITSTGNTKITGTIGAGGDGNALDGVSINGGTSTANARVSGTAVGAGAGLDEVSINGCTPTASLNPIVNAVTGAGNILTNVGCYTQNNTARLIIDNGRTVTISGTIQLTEGSEIVIRPGATLNIYGMSFTAGDETITYTHSSVNKDQMYGSCKIDDLLGDHNDDDHDSSGFGVAVMGDEALPLVDAIGC